MRARSIKPSICDNEILGTADPFYTLLFERLWMIADRQGRLEDRPLRIKAQAFPYREGMDVDGMLTWLHQQGFIRRYSVKGCKYIQVLAFSRHQSPHKNEQESVIPPPDEESTTKAVPEHNQGSAMDALTPDSGLLTPDSGLRVSAREAVLRDTGHLEQRIQAEYPKFSGRQDWLTAFHAAGNLIGDGHATADDLIAGVKRYAAYVAAGGVSEQRYVMTPAKFFTGADRPWRQEWQPPPKKLTAMERIYAATGGQRVIEHE